MFETIVSQAIAELGDKLTPEEQTQAQEFVQTTLSNMNKGFMPANLLVLQSCINTIARQFGEMFAPTEKVHFAAQCRHGVSTDECCEQCLEDHYDRPHQGDPNSERPEDQ